VRLRIPVLVAALALTPSAVWGQSCGILPAAEEARVLEGLSYMLFSPEAAEGRDSVIQQLGPVADPGTVVRDDSVCQAVIQRMVIRMRRYNNRWKAGDPPFTAFVFQFGPYYVGMMRERVLRSPGALTIPSGRGTKFIFRASDLEYLLGVV
jgi:hypothetical protein